MLVNREDVVQSALNVQRWCKNHYKTTKFPFGDLICDCPFLETSRCKFYITGEPWTYGLEEFLRTRGMKKGDVLS